MGSSETQGTKFSSLYPIIQLSNTIIMKFTTTIAILACALSAIAHVQAEANPCDCMGGAVKLTATHGDCGKGSEAFDTNCRKCLQSINDGSGDSKGDNSSGAARTQVMSFGIAGVALLMAAQLV